MNKHTLKRLVFFHPLLYALIGCGEGATGKTTSPNSTSSTSETTQSTTSSIKNKTLFAIAGDSKRADDTAEEQIFYSRWLKDFHIDYIHTPVTSIVSADWTNGASNIKAQLPRIVAASKAYGIGGENVIVAYELGTNDIDHCKNEERVTAAGNGNHDEVKTLMEECKDIVYGQLKTGIQSIKNKLPNARIYLSRPALGRNLRLKEIYKKLATELHLLLVDSPIEKFQIEHKEKKEPTNFQAYFKDDTHPTYAGMFSILYADLACILPEEEKSKLRQKREESLYTDPSSWKQGNNIAAGIKPEHYIMMDDDKKSGTGDAFISMTVPVTGGSILKIKSPIKFHSIIALDKNGKGVDGNDNTTSKINVSAVADYPDLYRFIYIPKGTTKIVINFLDTEGVNLPKLQNTGIELTYATPDEMKSGRHPDLKEITSHTATCIGSQYWNN